MFSVKASVRAVALFAAICIVSLFLISSPVSASPTEQSVTYNINLGDECLEKGDFNGAIAYYEKACDLYPDMVEPYILIGEVWYQKGDYATAISLADSALGLEEDNTDALILKAKSLESEGQTQNALNLFFQAYRIEPNNDEAVLGYARTVNIQSGPMGGIDALLRVSGEQGGLSSPAVLDYLGDLYSDAGEIDKAKNAYVLVLQRDPEFGNTDQKLKELAAEPAADTGKTIGAVEVTSATHPGYAREWFDSGMYLMERRAYEEAIDSFEQAFGNDPSLSEEVFVNIGHAYLKLGDDEQARSYLMSALNENPQNAPAWNNLGVLAEKAGSVDSARNCYQMALSADPSYAPAQWNMMVMEGKLQIYGILGILILLVLLGVLLLSAWRYSLKKKNPHQGTFGWTGALIGGCLGGLVALQFIFPHRLMGFFNIVIGCTLLGWYLGRCYLEKILNLNEQIVPYGDMAFYRWVPYLTPGLIFVAIYGGFANTFYSSTEYFGTINGMVVSMLLLYFSFDFTVCHTPTLKDSHMVRIRSDWVFLLIAISLFYFAIQIPFEKISPMSPIESGAIVVFLGLIFIIVFFAMLDTFVKNSTFVLRRVLLIIVYYIIFAFIGAAYYTFLLPYEFGGTCISEMPLFLIPLCLIAGHFIFTPFDKKVGSINEISLNQDREEAEQKKNILKKIERTTGMDLSGNEKQGEKR